ncbi:hypothetical protein LTR62_003123 [Meristemomyces frigidus]|uniref:Glycosyltransferase family 28 N-terminal domain-containing protein n=1 Tax=Meristemomyces frigidus TaxID=1508187 RepID=A0AAN7TFV1_9PEZI|nr:hypothetical protein LTR62_003123 [Meristemomyces frigidus]
MAHSQGKQPERADMSPEPEQRIPINMLDQAAAAADSESRSQNPTERRHMGQDVPLIQDSTTDLQTDIPAPAYGGILGELKNSQDGLGADAKVGDDGRVNIRISQSNRSLSNILTPVLRKQQEGIDREDDPPPPYIPPSLGGDEEESPPPPMNVVIQIVGSRGDVQPFVALGRVLKSTYGHRVRLATHPVFKDFVLENGLEFFSIGGDPAQLMAFMVKNPGLMPSFDALRAGDVGRRRKEIGEYLNGCWRSCYETGDGLGAAATDNTVEEWDLRNPGRFGVAEEIERPFVADCIIANPPSFAHVHIAEKMGIPLHIMFTMPYSPTQAFPHPLANIQSSNADPNLTNYITYALIDMLTWQGLGDIINKFRQKSLGLEPISLVWAPGMMQRLKIPHTYCWSPSLIPKPKDWGQQVSISGFFFLNLASDYTPDVDLKAFLDAGPPPVYIGFGSIVLDDPNAMTKLLFDAVRKSGQRALVSKGWGGMGADELGKPDGVFMLGNCPHDWLFQRVSCVVHHGGAGTTAAGITAGRPTVIVPFFGDQPFWGAMVARAGAGPDPIPSKELTADKLAAAIEVCLQPSSQERAKELANSIAHENGSQVGAQAFHQHLSVDSLRCNLSPARAAVWRLKRTQVRLSAMAACTLANAGLLDFNDIKLFRPREYETDDGPWDPITGGATALVGTISTMMMGVADMPIDTLKALNIHPEAAAAAKEKREKKKAAALAADTEHADEGDDGSSTTKSLKPSRSSVDTASSSGSNTPATSRTNSTFNYQESMAKLQQQSSPLSPAIPASMADALRGQLGSSGHSKSRSPSRSGSAAPAPGGKQPAKTGSGENPLETYIDTGKGIKKIVGAGFSSPMDFTMSLAKGFHNAPKLYGDDTVRKADQVTDFRSGVKAATKEFGYGMFDGITGLVSQPLRGAQKEGVAGFVKGVGKGIGGIVLKPGAAVFGIPGYTMKGLYKEMQMRFGSSVQNYIIAARTAQGYDEWQGATEGERADVVRRWKGLQRDLKKKRNPDEMIRDVLEEQRRRKMEGLRHMRERITPPSCSRSRSNSASLQRPASQPQDPARGGLHPEAPPPPAWGEGSQGEDDDLKEAIRLSVLESSQGNEAEDRQVEEAMRASMADLQRSRTTEGHAELAEDEEMQRALARSLGEQRGMHVQPEGMAGMSVPVDHDAILRNREQLDRAQGSGNNTQQQGAEADAGHIEGTTREVHELSGTGDSKTQQERSEEEIVMEYVRKQSLLEEKNRGGAGGSASK